MAAGRRSAAPHDRFWLFGTGRRVLSKRYRSTSRWHNLLGRLAAEQRPKVQAAEWAGDPAQERLLTAIRELKPSYREALLLVHWEQLTYTQRLRRFSSGKGSPSTPRRSTSRPERPGSARAR